MTTTESHLVDEAMQNGARIVSDVNDFLMGGGGRSAEFKEEGSGVQGTIIKTQMRQQTDFESGELLFWNDGNPRMQAVITLETEYQDDDEDDGLRNVYCKGQMQQALAKAVRAAGEKGIANGGTLAIQWATTAEPARRGLSGAKQYQVWYWPPPEGYVPIDEPPDEPPPEESFNESLAEVDPADLPF